MSDWVELLIRMPLRLFGLSLELLNRITQIVAESGQSVTPMPAAAGLGVPAAATAQGPLSNQIVQNYGKEQRMRDQDLGGDDLKVIRYRIIYTKRDHEAFLEDGDTLIDYRTTAADYGGLLICSFMEKVAKGEIKLPAKVGKTISQEDRRYVRITLEVVDRFPRESGEYDRRKVQELASIHRAITEVSSKIAPS
jgi:hypothetical protein